MEAEPCCVLIEGSGARFQGFCQQPPSHGCRKTAQPCKLEPRFVEALLACDRRRFPARLQRSGGRGSGSGAPCALWVTFDLHGSPWGLLFFREPDLRLCCCRSLGEVSPRLDLRSNVQISFG